VIYLGYSQKEYAMYVEGVVDSTLAIAAEIVLSERRTLEECLERAQERGIKYLIAISWPQEVNRTVLLTIVRRSGRHDKVGEVSIFQVLELLASEEGVKLSQKAQMLPPFPPLSAAAPSELPEHELVFDSDYDSFLGKRPGGEVGVQLPPQGMPLVNDSLYNPHQAVAPYPESVDFNGLAHAIKTLQEAVVNNTYLPSTPTSSTTPSTPPQQPQHLPPTAPSAPPISDLTHLLLSTLTNGNLNQSQQQSMVPSLDILQSLIASSNSQNAHHQPPHHSNAPLSSAPPLENGNPLLHQDFDKGKYQVPRAVSAPSNKQHNYPNYGDSILLTPQHQHNNNNNNSAYRPIVERIPPPTAFTTPPSAPRPYHRV